jgi:hypothetical protein
LPDFDGYPGVTGVGPRTPDRARTDVECGNGGRAQFGGGNRGDAGAAAQVEHPPIAGESGSFHRFDE